MKNLNSILLATVLLLTVNACKKSTPSPNPNTGTSGLLKSMTSIVTNSGHTDTLITTFTYDSQNRVITQIMTAFAVSSTTTYAYYTDSVVMVTSGVSITYHLNSAGAKTSDNLGDTWTYNSNGYLSSELTASGYTTTYTYNSLNQLATQTNVAAGVTTTDTYSYSSNPIGTASTTWQMGKSTGALPATDINVKNGVTTTTTYTYVLNAQNKLGTETVTSSAAGTSPVITYFAYY